MWNALSHVCCSELMRQMTLSSVFSTIHKNRCKIRFHVKFNPKQGYSLCSYLIYKLFSFSKGFVPLKGFHQSLEIMFVFSHFYKKQKDKSYVLRPGVSMNCNCRPDKNFRSFILVPALVSLTATISFTLFHGMDRRFLGM